jgi:serine/threonine protein kinase
MANRTGQQLGNYRLVRFLGQGGFADVYLGEHVYLKSYAALKVLHRTLKEEDVECFLSEAQTLVQLRHAHIVRVLEFIFEQDTPMLIMDYALGGTARQRYPNGSCLPLATTVAYIRQVAAALQYAHNHSIIHRDVKPDNILFDSDRQILLGDFGLALFAPSPEQLSTQEWVGTLPYMAPEQLQGKSTFASDQYALGILTYEWLCGVRPFEGDRWTLMHQHMYVAPPPLREKCPGLPASVERVVLRALAKDPQERFTSIQAFALAFERASRENVLDVNSGSETTATLTPPSPPPLVAAPTHTVYGPQAQRRIFLMAAPADEAFAVRLQVDLEAQGIVVSRAPEVGTLNQPDKLRHVISDAQMILVVVSPDTRSSRTIKEQLRIVSMYQQRLVFVRARGDDIAAVLPEAWGRTALIDLVDARGTRYMAALAEIIALLQESTPIASPQGATLPIPMPLEEPRNPYKGLRAFTKDDAVDFFGRDGLIEELAETIEGFLTAEKPTVPASRLLTVIGPSGSGKSSVVMAGLLPGLRRGALPGSQEWVYLDPIVPGKRPLEALTLAFAPRLPERSLQSIRHDLEDDSARGLHLLTTQLVKRAGCKVVLMIDQFEELFTHALSEQERQRFIDLLVTAVTEPGGSLIVLLTLRADFYERPMHYSQLSQLIEVHQKSVLPMNPHELRTVIEQPAALPDVQVLFEGNLVGDLLFETQGQAGTLPLLEFTLDQLFQLRDGHWLTRQAYQQIGGVKGALAKHAESTYESLPSEEHRRLARALFLRLIDPGVTEQDTTRRRASLAELSLADSEQTKIMREVADTFVAARLLMTNEIAGTTTIEVSHEALIREWTRLAEWLCEAREDIHLQQTMSKALTEWQRRGKPKDRLYRGSQLKEAKAWARRNIPSKQETAFLRASVQRQMLFVASMIMILLLFISTSGAAIRFFLLLPPDPTLVTNREDEGVGSLRWAMNSVGKGSIIHFAPDLRGTIFLRSNDLTFVKNMTIRGPGAQTLAISGGKSGLIVRVLPGVTVALFDLSFINSNTGPTGTGFIKNEGTLMLTNSIVSGNTSSDVGGGIINTSEGNLTLTNSTVSRNRSQYGGGIYNNSSGQLTLIHSTISENLASQQGGGIYDWVDQDHQTTIISCTISGNTAHDGGGIFVDNGHSIDTRKSSITGNHAAAHPDMAGPIISSQ